MRLFVNQLTVMDFSWLDARQGLLGESWLVDIELQGSLDEQGMVLDFGEVKRQVKQLIDEHFDHRLLVPEDHPRLQRAKQELTMTLDNGSIVRHRGPAEAVQFIPGDHIRASSVAHAIRQMLAVRLPGNVEQITIRLYPEKAEDCWYQYSHGLKLHCGNCQRIAHGHRSQIRILRNNRPDPAQERYWSNRFQGVYIATQDDLQAITQHHDQTHYRFAYRAEQGDFELELPASRCYLIETESTVENIARHIRNCLKRKFPSDRFEVQAFEGIGKGAISSTPQLLTGCHQPEP